MKLTGKIILFCAAILTIVACSDKQVFTVKGVVGQAKGKTIYLENVGVSEIILLDSAKLGDNGKFSFKQARPETPDFYRLRVDGQWINFAVDSIENITIQADNAADMTKSYQIEGSENSLKIKELTLLQMEASDAFNKLLKEQQKDSVDHEAYVSEGLAILQKYKDVAKKYIFEDPKSTASYFALYQQIDNMLIFDPYNKEDNRIYSTVATSWDSYYGNSLRAKQLHTLTLQGLKVIRGKRAEQSYDNVEVKEALSYFEIALPDINGATVKLSDLVKEGKVIILDFTAYQSQFSPDHNMDLGTLYEKHKDKGLTIFQVSLDGDQHFWQNISSRIPWICVRDAESVYSKIAAVYNVRDLPTSFILNRKGEIVKRVENDADLEAEIKKVL